MPSAPLPPHTTRKPPMPKSLLPPPPLDENQTFYPRISAHKAESMVPTKNLLFFFCWSLISWRSTHGSTFTFVNKCDYTVWPGILSNAGSSPLPTTGFELPIGTSRSFQAPSGWSGRFWGRTSCSMSPTTNLFTCSTGDCGSGTLECSGAGAAPPATLAEFTLGGSGGKDFYDVSLVDGYNLPMMVDVTGGKGDGCLSTGCPVDLNRACPAELRVGSGEACKSACEAFGKPEYCCSGAFANPNTCRPSVYSQMFKTACPRSYSYAYDDASSTFTCAGADYSITFCPSAGPSLKSSRDPNPSPTSDSNDTPRTSTSAGGAMVEYDTWLANLATGDATTMRRRVSFFYQSLLVASTTIIVCLL